MISGDMDEVESYTNQERENMLERGMHVQRATYDKDIAEVFDHVCDDKCYDGLTA